MELTILGLQISMQNHAVALLRLIRQECLPIPDLSLISHARRIFPVVASEQSTYQLCKDLPDKLLFGVAIPIFQLLDVSAEVAIPTVLHVEVEVMARLEMFAVAVLDDVWMTEGFEDAQFGVQLVLFLVGHAAVGDFFAA